MKLHIINSNSAGNCYILHSENGTLIIELGVSISAIKKALNFDINNVVGALVTHEHLDHAKSINEAIALGINVYASTGTFNKLNITGHRINAIKAHVSFKLGNFTIMPFDVDHDAMEPLGFIINHPESGNILFATDTFYMKYYFNDLQNIIIESNYSEQIIEEKKLNGDINNFLANRIIKSHMSLETCISFLLSNDLTNVNNIVLIHLSNSNSDAGMFEREIKSVTGKNVHIAKENMTIDFNKTPF